MGLNIKGFHYIQQMVYTLDKEFATSRICLLGNLYFARGTECLQKKAKTKVVHTFFENLGADVVSIDLNGKDKALPLDLQKPLPKSIGTFDIIINGGTSEHVKEHDMCFQNIHDICRSGGIMFHSVPHVGSWLDHCLHYYDEPFFRKLAEKYHYSVVDICIDDYVGADKKLVLACLRKEHNG